MHGFFRSFVWFRNNLKNFHNFHRHCLPSDFGKTNERRTPNKSRCCAVENAIPSESKAHNLYSAIENLFVEEKIPFSCFPVFLLLFFSFHFISLRQSFSDMLPCVCVFRPFGSYVGKLLRSHCLFQIVRTTLQVYCFARSMRPAHTFSTARFIDSSWLCFLCHFPCVDIHSGSMAAVIKKKETKHRCE